MSVTKIAEILNTTEYAVRCYVKTENIELCKGKQPKRDYSEAIAMLENGTSYAEVTRRTGISDATLRDNFRKKHPENIPQPGSKKKQRHRWTTPCANS